MEYGYITKGTLMLISSNQVIDSWPTVEPLYKNNERNTSAIPLGNYKMVMEYSPKFRKRLWELKGVPNRTEIKIHLGKQYHETQGCILMVKEDLDRLHKRLIPHLEYNIQILSHLKTNEYVF